MVANQNEGRGGGAEVKLHTLAGSVGWWSVVFMCPSGFIGGRDVFSKKKETRAGLDRIVMQASIQSQLDTLVSLSNFVGKKVSNWF